MKDQRWKEMFWQYVVLETLSIKNLMTPRNKSCSWEFQLKSRQSKDFLSAPNCLGIWKVFVIPFLHYEWFSLWFNEMIVHLILAGNMGSTNRNLTIPLPRVTLPIQSSPTSSMTLSISSHCSERDKRQSDDINIQEQHEPIEWVKYTI